MSSGLIRTAALSPTSQEREDFVLSVPRLKRPSLYARWAAALVILPVFVQAPWVRLHPFSAGLFTVVLLTIGTCLGIQDDPGRSRSGALIVGFSGSWLAGTFFWGWLRAHPTWHLPVEAIALPLALAGLNSRWRLGCAFYLSSLLGTALTDMAMAFTGVMRLWPEVVNAPLDQAQPLLHQAAAALSQPGSVAILTGFTGLILAITRLLQQQNERRDPTDSSWAVAASVLVTTLVIDGLFVLTATLQPSLSGLI